VIKATDSDLLYQQDKLQRCAARLTVSRTRRVDRAAVAAGDHIGRGQLLNFLGL
jgi:hypothetical protein